HDGAPAMRRARNATVDLKGSCSLAPVRPVRSAVPTKEQCGVCEKRRATCVAQWLRARQEIFQDRAHASASSTLSPARPARRPLLPRDFGECRKRWQKVAGYACE